MPVTTTGFIGIGNMGLGMALRLRDLGFAVGVRDIDPAREALAAAHGAAVHASPAALALRCDVVVVAVVDAAQCEAVLFGADGARPLPEAKLRQGFLEGSNVDPVLEIARMVEVQRAYELGQSFLDAEDQRIRAAISSLTR